MKILEGMETALPEESQSVEYISSSSLNQNSSLSSHSTGIATPCTTPSNVIEIMGSSISDTYSPMEPNNYYCYEYDHRSYKMSAVVGRNYLYPTPTPFNQVCATFMENRKVRYFLTFRIIYL